MASLDVDAYSLNGVKTIEAEYWITNLHAKDDNGSWKLSIDKDTVGEDGKSVAELAPSERHVTADETYNTVFWQAPPCPTMTRPSPVPKLPASVTRMTD